MNSAPFTSVAVETKPPCKVLVADDEKIVRVALAQILKGAGCEVIEAADGGEALDRLKRDDPSAVLLDLKLPDMPGIQVLQKMRATVPEVPVIIVTGLDDIQVAVDTIKFGAYDFIVKPPKPDRLLVTIQRAIEKSCLSRTLKRLSDFMTSQIEGLIGTSIAMREVVQQIQQVAVSDFSVVLQGETGSGKNYIARAIHNLSRRASGHFVSIDMGAIPDALVESELFGYEKGAFTGAERKKKGLFEVAHGGTILIDELQNMSPFIQSKLLKVVEEQRFYPLGSTSPTEIDVRIISSTNADLRRAVEEKRFREDLFFRLGEFMITIPPLRKRCDDIPALAQKFFMEATEELNRPMREVSGEAMDMLMGHSWPGNVRELKNVIRRAALLASDGVIRPENISFLLKQKGEATPASASVIPLKELGSMVLREAESKAIRQALKQTRGNKTQAASLLKIDYKTLLTKIREYEITS